MTGLAILGSSGSIGRSALEVVRRHPDRFRVEALAVHSSVEVLAAQVREFRPSVAIVVDPSRVGSLPDTPDTRWLTGAEALIEGVAMEGVDVVLNAIVGAAGLEPTLQTLLAGRRLALANKESLVAGGELVLEASRRGGGELIPVDSEHSAILQCMHGARTESVARVVLTASGGPFRGWDRERLAGVGPEDALRHPTWNMGAKITVDSATLANKALEVIEAHFLYGLDYDRIDAVVHPQSIIHSFVEFGDGSVLAQLGFPTMELPILYALTHPSRVLDRTLQTYDPVKASPLTFEAVDSDAFRMFALGVEAGRRGGAAPAVYNAANETVVEAFLDHRLGFLEMADVVEDTMERCAGQTIESLPELLHVDAEARRIARQRVATS